MTSLFEFGLERMLQLTGANCTTTIDNELIEFKGILDQESELVQDERGTVTVDHMFRLTVLRDIALQIPRDVKQTITVNNKRYTVRHILLRGDGETCEIYLTTSTPMNTPCQDGEIGC